MDIMLNRRTFFGQALAALAVMPFLKGVPKSQISQHSGIPLLHSCSICNLCGFIKNQAGHLATPLHIVVCEHCKNTRRINIELSDVKCKYRGNHNEKSLYSKGNVVRIGLSVFICIKHVWMPGTMTQTREHWQLACFRNLKEAKT